MHKCEECDYATHIKGNLVNHMRKHRGTVYPNINLLTRDSDLKRNASARRQRGDRFDSRLYNSRRNCP